MTFLPLRTAVVVLGIAASCAPLAAAPLPPEEADRVVRQALAARISHADQAEELVQLAWLREGVPPEVSEIARRDLESWGARVIPTLRRAMARVRTDQTASVVQTILVARESQSAGVPLDYVVALVDALWIGSADAKRLAIPYLAMQGERLALLPLIDAALEEPSLVPDVIRALGVIGDDRGRFWLEKVLHEGRAGDREAAAVALARIGGRAMTPLRDALRSANRDVRLAAARAILPVATPDELTAFYVYLAEHADDDPATSQALRAAAAVIEEKREAQRAADAASAPDDF
jgi:hypothetical protein